MEWITLKASRPNPAGLRVKVLHFEAHLRLDQVVALEQGDGGCAVVLASGHSFDVSAEDGARLRAALAIRPDASA